MDIVRYISDCIVDLVYISSDVLRNVVNDASVLVDR